MSQVLNRWASQDVARRNAGRASVRMMHTRRQREEVLGFLDEVPDDTPLQPPRDPRS